jgi:ribosome-binding protein aMBF1 (putative translation factor)
MEMKKCEMCGKEMEKYSPYGKEYKICAECASKLPDPLSDLDNILNNN